jgi:hypothetical protein
METFDDPLALEFRLVDNSLSHIFAKELKPGGLSQRQVLNNSKKD